MESMNDPELGKRFARMVEEAEATGGIASPEMLRIIRQTRASGEHVPEIEAYVSENLRKARAALEQHSRDEDG
jgi:hypothetical protein